MNQRKRLHERRIKHLRVVERYGIDRKQLVFKDMIVDDFITEMRDKADRRGLMI